MSQPHPEHKNNFIISIVDDNADMQRLVRAMLSADSRLVLLPEINSAEDAIRSVEVHSPSLVILDHTLKGEMTGLEAAPLIRRVSPSTKVLLFSAHELSKEVRGEPAVDYYLPKTKVCELLPTVLNILNRVL